MDSTINILSYNSTGCDSDKVNFINDLVSTLQIHLFSIQEHFKATQSIESYFRKQFPNYYSFVKSAVRDNESAGRPKGGLAQF